MTKIYQIKSTNAQGQAQTESITPANGAQPTVIKAIKGLRYNLVDVQTGFAPENIRVNRQGKNLRVYFESTSTPSLVLEDFYDAEADHLPSLVGQNERGALYEYVPEAGAESQMIGQLTDNGQAYGSALGGQELAGGAAVGLLAPVAAGFNPLLLAAGALGAAGLGGGGGGAGNKPTIPTVLSAQLGADDTGPKGDNITKDQTPTIKGKTDAAGALVTAKLTVNGEEKTYTTTAGPDGSYEIIIPEAGKLPQGRYVPKVTATLNGLTSEEKIGDPFIVDLSTEKNINDQGVSNADLNASATTAITAIDIDSAVTTDFWTSDNQLIYKGTVQNFKENGDWLEVQLLKVTTNGSEQIKTLVASDYIKPTLGAWTWDQNQQSMTRDDGTYELTVSVVDGAGNVVSTVTKQTIVIDTSATKNPDGDDANVKASLKIVGIHYPAENSLDTGVLQDDFITSDTTLVFKGTVSNGAANGDLVKLELTGTSNNTKKTTETYYATFDSDGNWSWPHADALGNGTYTLKATLVDKAGNKVKPDNGTEIATSKNLVIDTSANNLPDGAADPNAALTPSFIKLNVDSGNNFTGADSDWITNDIKPTVTGQFSNGKNWTNNGDVFKIEIIDEKGNLKGVFPDADGAGPSNNLAVLTSPSAWASSESGISELSNGKYTARATVEDAAGNVSHVSQHNFIIDTAVSQTIIAYSVGTHGEYHNIHVDINEAVHYKIINSKNGNSIVLSEGNFDGTTVITPPITGEFNAKELQILLTDKAGNTSSSLGDAFFTNNSSWSLTNQSITLNKGENFATPDVTKSSIITYTLEADMKLDLTSLIPVNQNETGKQVAINDIDMTSTSEQRVTIQLSDLLHLGITNAFDTTTKEYTNDIQMRIRGDKSDIVELETGIWSDPNTSAVITLDGKAYTVYTSIDGLHDLMIEQTILQENIKFI